MESAVRQEILLCPSSALVFAELAEQRLPEKREATAGLMDRLSRGLVLASPPDRVFLEVLRFVQSAVAGAPFPHAPLGEVWTCPSFAFGHTDTQALPESIPGSDAVNSLVVQDLWDRSHPGGPSRVGARLRLARFSFKLKSATSQRGEAGCPRALLVLPTPLTCPKSRGALDVSCARPRGSPALPRRHGAGIDVSEVSPDRPIEAAQAVAALLHAAFKKHDLGCSSCLRSMSQPHSLRACSGTRRGSTSPTISLTSCMRLRPCRTATALRRTARWPPYSGRRPGAGVRLHQL